MTTTGSPPAPGPAQLRHLIMTHFDSDEIESICFDLGIDYDSLAGDSKLRKVIELIEHCARAGRIVVLIDQCARLRAITELGWDDLRAAAIANPQAFLPQTVEPTPQIGESKSVINLSPDRALKLGIALGALMMALVACGFSGGLVAGRFIQFTDDPVLNLPNTGAQLAGDFAAIEALPAGASTRLEVDNIQATSYANRYLIGPDSPITQIHARFLDTSQTSVNMTVTLPVLGQRQVVAAYNIDLDQGRMVIAPEAASVRLLNTGGIFGWVAIPNFMLDPVTRFAQSRLDALAKTVSVDRLAVSDGRIRLWLTRK